MWGKTIERGEREKQKKRERAPFEKKQSEGKRKRGSERSEKRGGRVQRDDWRRGEVRSVREREWQWAHGM